MLLLFQWPWHLKTWSWWQWSSQFLEIFSHWLWLQHDWFHARNDLKEALFLFTDFLRLKNSKHNMAIYLKLNKTKLEFEFHRLWSTPGLFCIMALTFRKKYNVLLNKLVKCQMLQYSWLCDELAVYELNAFCLVAFSQIYNLNVSSTYQCWLFVAQYHIMFGKYNGGANMILWKYGWNIGCVLE